MSVPGIRDLMTSALIVEDSQKCALAAANCLLPITCGIEAIGALMGSFDDDAGLPDGTLQDIGHLLAFLSRLSSQLQDMKASAEFELRGGIKALIA